MSSFATPLLKERDREEETPVKTFKTQQHQQQNSLFASCNSRESRGMEKLGFSSLGILHLMKRRTQHTDVVVGLHYVTKKTEFFFIVSA